MSYKDQILKEITNGKFGNKVYIDKVQNKKQEKKISPNAEKSHNLERKINHNVGPISKKISEQPIIKTPIKADVNEFKVDVNEWQMRMDEMEKTLSVMSTQIQDLLNNQKNILELLKSKSQE